MIIDGSEGEGGGQILRTCLALACLCKTPIIIKKIRGRRKKPGLMRQHLTAVEAAARISGARTEGAELGSTELEFLPGEVRPGEYRFSVGTAGSACLVLQTILPPLLTARGPSRLVLEGGTHNPMAPPFEFLAETFFPQLATLGARITAELDRPGFFPAGGGRMRVRIEPCRRLLPLSLLERGEFLERRAIVLHAHLPREIAERELAMMRKELELEEQECDIRQLEESRGPGNVVLFRLRFASITEIFTGFGRKGVPASKVVTDLTREVRAYLRSTAPVDVHLADQLIVPLAMAGSGELRTVEISRHASTNMDVVSRFLPVRFSLDRGEGGSVVVTASPSSP